MTTFDEKLCAFELWWNDQGLHEYLDFCSKALAPVDATTAKITAWSGWIASQSHWLKQEQSRLEQVA